MQIVLLESLGVSDAVMEKHRARLEKMGQTLLTYEKNTDPEVQVERCRKADVVMLANMPLDPSVIREASNLKFIDVAFTGVDHIPVAAAREKGIAVSNASGYATQAVAELCVSFMIQLLRNVEATQDRCRSGGTKDGLIGSLLCGKTVGIVGAGAIGRRVAALCKAFSSTPPEGMWRIRKPWPAPCGRDRSPEPPATSSTKSRRFRPTIRCFIRPTPS